MYGETQLSQTPPVLEWQQSLCEKAGTVSSGWRAERCNRDTGRSRPSGTKLPAPELRTEGEPSPVRLMVPSLVSCRPPAGLPAAL
ncbi:hypothetical protein AAFF_G00125430 [Aldrovandia affinis]|uniref:Uncharacterized protein n=1 Tax=Aldrovandia affinis TaxID=143900 RepID=A0AAD7RRI3_9TELE|nr:hypothetical protein AAFF_G00125430 [Aldrovandia affinis]